MNIAVSQISNIEFDGVDTRDYPDFCDAFITSCDIDNREANEDELDWINDNLIGEFYDDIYQSLIP